jgi:type I restriction enzyme S subunit
MSKELTIENTILLDSWKTMKLVDVCIVERGSSPRPIKKYITDDENGVNWIKIGDTKNIEKYIYETNQKIKKEGAVKSRFVEEGDFILSNSMSFGKPYIMKTQGYIHDGWFRLKLHDFIDTEYFYQLLSSPLVNDQFHDLASGSVVKNISGDLVKKVNLPIPPLPQQKQIVATLDKAFAAIDTAKANAEQNLKNAKELFESYLQNVFENKGDDWEEKRLNDISTNLDRLRVPITKKDRQEGTIPYYGASGIVDYVADCLFDEDLLCISEDGANLLARTYPIAFSISGKTWVNNHAHVLRFENISSQYFVEYYLNLIKLNDFVSGMAQPKLNQTQLNRIPIPIPNTLDEQREIVQKLDSLSAETEKLEAIYIQKIADLEEMRKSVLQKAFSGQLNTVT